MAVVFRRFVPAIVSNRVTTKKGGGGWEIIENCETSQIENRFSKQIRSDVRKNRYA